MVFSSDGLYTARGEIHTLSEWSEITGICRTTLFTRVKKQPAGEPFENVLGEVRTPKLYSIGGDFHTLREWSEITGISWDTLHTRVNRMKKGESFESVLYDVVSTPTYKAFGEVHTLADWAKIIGISKGSLQSRLKRKKPDEPFEVILFEKRDQTKYYEAFGEVHSLLEWAKLIGVNVGVLRSRLYNKSPSATFESILFERQDPTKTYSAFGESHTISEWSEISGISCNTLYRRLSALDPCETFEKVLDVKSREITTYFCRGVEHTLTEWSDLLSIPYPWLYRMVHDKKMTIEAANEFYHLGDNKAENEMESDYSRFIPDVGYKQIREKYSNDPDKSFQWQCFYNRMRRNPFPRQFLFERQHGICPVCNMDLGEDQTYMHYVNYDHLCSFVMSPRDLITVSCPTKKNPSGKLRVPNCEICMQKCRSEFDECMSNFILVHGHCNEMLAYHWEMNSGNF